MSTFQNVQEIPQRNIDLAFGFMREIADGMKDTLNTIPQGIKMICLTYFNLNRDTFNGSNIAGSVILIEENVINDMDSLYINIYLDNVVSQGTSIWKFQCISDLESYIGIHNTKFEESFCRLFDATKDESISTGYALGTFGNLTNPKNPVAWCRSYTTYDPDWIAKDDVISMTLDMDSRTLSYKINDFDYGKAFDVKHAKYTAAVALDSNAIGDGWKFISFQHIC